MAQAVDLQDALHGGAVTLGDLNQCFTAFNPMMHDLCSRSADRRGYLLRL